MVKIGIAIALPLIIGFIAFPQFRVAIFGLAPFALFALCPLGMLFGMKGMMGEKEGKPCSSCGHVHAETKHVKIKESLSKNI